MSVLTFLVAFKCEPNNNGISESTTKVILRYFLTGNARIAYDSAFHFDVINYFSVGLKLWPENIKWLLCSHAKDEYTQDLVRDRRTLRQRNGEIEQFFGHRVCLTFARLRGVYFQEKQIASFIEKLLSSISSFVTRDPQLHRDRLTTVHAVVELPMSHGYTSRLTMAPSHPFSAKIYQPKTSVMSVEVTNFSPNTAPTGRRSGSDAV